MTRCSCECFISHGVGLWWTCFGRRRSSCCSFVTSIGTAWCLYSSGRGCRLSHSEGFRLSCSKEWEKIFGYLCYCHFSWESYGRQFGIGLHSLNAGCQWGALLSAAYPSCHWYFVLRNLTISFFCWGLHSFESCRLCWHRGVKSRVAPLADGTWCLSEDRETALCLSPR